MKMRSVPEQSALQWAETFGLTSSAVPVRIAPLAISMIWHAKRKGDAGVQWLRGIVRDVVASEMGEIGLRRNAAGARKDRRAPALILYFAPECAISGLLAKRGCKHRRIR
jgi:hypothetical protein